MSKKLKKLFKKENIFFKKHSGFAIRASLGVAALVLVYGLSVLLTHKYYLPYKTKEFANTSVMVIDKNLQSGGTGVIIKSTSNKSLILTNNHVCEVIKDGGFVVQNNKQYLIDLYSRYPFHDLCMVSVSHNFNVNTKIATSPPTQYSKASISGHPNLLPHVLTTGNFSGYKVIHVLTGVKNCPKKEENPKEVPDKTPTNSDEFWCQKYGVIPMFQTYQSQLVTGTILPGSSGSAVYNSNGEISAIVFAGHSRGFSYAFVVPYEYVLDFTKAVKYNSVSWHVPGKDLNKKSTWLKRFNIPEVFTGKLHELKNNPKLKEILINVKKINSNN